MDGADCERAERSSARRVKLRRVLGGADARAERPFSREAAVAGAVKNRARGEHLQASGTGRGQRRGLEGDFASCGLLRQERWSCLPVPAIGLQ